MCFDMTETELQDALDLAKKRYEAALWMKQHGIKRVDRLPNYVAVKRAEAEIVAREWALIAYGMEWRP